MAWSQTLLERYGVVSREAIAGENLPGGFAPLYQTYKVLEKGGRVRRGYFVEGLSGAQFAWAQTVDRLRSEAIDGEQSGVVVLSTPDPANPYGSLLPWPQSGGRPRRASGTRLVLFKGHPVFFLEKGGKKLISFAKAQEPGILSQALEGLREVARQNRGRSLKIREIDGQAALNSPLAAKLMQFGFKDDYQGLLLMDTPR